MRFRVYVELEWFKTLFKEQIVSQDKSLIANVLAQKDFMDSIFDNFSVEDGLRVKEIERTTNPKREVCLELSSSKLERILALLMHIRGHQQLSLRFDAASLF